MKPAHTIRDGELTIPPNAPPSGAGAHLQSDKTLIGLLLIAINLCIFFAFQAGNSDFKRGDFKMFYTAAVFLRTGRPFNIYAPDSYAAMQHKSIPSLTPAEVKPYTHPPYELLVVVPFSFLSYRAACWCWLMFVLLLGIVCGRIMRSYAGIMGMFPFFFVLLYQQDSMITLLILISCWFALKESRDVLAGLILGLALFRFQIIIPLALVLAFWRPRVLKGFAVSGALIFALSVAMVRPAGMIDYWHYLLGMTGASYSTAMNAYHMSANWNVALRGLVFELLNNGKNSTRLITAVTGILGVIILGIAWRFMRANGLRAETKFSFAIVTALLLSFHLLPHDLILLSLPFILLPGSVARWPLAGLYLATIPWSFGFPRDAAWFAFVPMCTLLAMIALHCGILRTFHSWQRAPDTNEANFQEG